MTQHLEYRPGTCRLIHHQNGKEDESAMGYGRVGVDVLQVGLHTSGESTVDNRNACQNQEYPAQLIGSLGHQIHGDAETSVSPQFHQYSGVKHGNGSRCRSMTVRAPRMKRKQSSQNTESQKSERKPDTLLCKRNAMQSGYFKDIHGSCT